MSWVGVGTGRAAGLAAPFSSDEALAIIEEEFGWSLRNIFAYLSMEPVAAASFGQVGDDKGMPCNRQCVCCFGWKNLVPMGTSIIYLYAKIYMRM